jgi:hypothetical protein
VKLIQFGPNKRLGADESELAQLGWRRPASEHCGDRRREAAHPLDVLHGDGRGPLHASVFIAHSTVPMVFSHAVGQIPRSASPRSIAAVRMWM